MEQVIFTGELTINRAEELVLSLQQALQGRREFKLNVDLTAVEWIDTAACQVLLAAKRQALQTAATITFDCSTTVCERLRNIGIQL